MDENEIDETDETHVMKDMHTTAKPVAELIAAPAAQHASLPHSHGYWQSLEELEALQSGQECVSDEFPPDAAVWPARVSRRNFLRLMGASLSLAGLHGCAKPPEQIVPYVRAPEEIVPGQPLFYATAFPLGGLAEGILVESHMGRPTKIEGNPQHPASLGATTALAQAAVLSLCDPDRSQVLTNAGQITTWDSLMATLSPALERQRVVQGAGLRILTETVTSPSLASQLQTLLNQFPAAKWHQYEPVGRGNARAGAQQAFGEVVDTHYRFADADIILALDADFLSGMPGSLRYTRDFTAKRQVRDDQTEMNRLYVVESTPSLTGAMADHRFPRRAAEIEQLIWSLAVALGVGLGVGLGGRGPTVGPAQLTRHAEPWQAALLDDLHQHRGKSVVVVGDSQPPHVHALVHAINHALGNIGSSVVYTDPVEAQPVDQLASLQDLVQDMDAGKVEILINTGRESGF